MNLDIIKLQTTWNDAAGSINSNYAKIADAIAQLKANGGGGGGGTDIDLTDYATKVWVAANYAPLTSVQGFENRIKGLEGAITKKADSATTLSGYGITDAYTKIDVDKLLEDNATKTWVNASLVNYATVNSVTTIKNTLTGQISTVSTNLSTLQTTVSNQAKTILANEQGLEELRTTVGDLGDAIPTNNNQLDNGAGYITSDALSPYAKTADVSITYATIASVQGFENRISGLEGAVPQLNERVSTIEGDYATKDYVTTKLVNYAPLTSVQGFENRIGGLEGAVPQLNDRVTTVESKVSSLNETVSTGENNLLDRVNVIEEEYATKTYVDNAIDGIDLSAYLLKADLTKSRIQSTLGISDWALSATKPSYAWSEITSRPTALSQFTDDVVAGKYLPLSGGELNAGANISWVHSNSESWQSTAKGIRTLYSAGTMNGGSPSNYSAGLHIAGNSNYAFQIAYNPASAYVLKYRGFDANSAAWNDWKQIAFITDNVASATKLQTPRTLWGNYFDGTDNISGAITLANNQSINVTFTDGTIKNALLLASSNNNLYLGYGTALSGASTFLWGKEIQFVNSSGQPIATFKDDKLGIGTNSPNVLLTVNGELRAAASIYLHNTNEINSFQGKLYLNHRGSGQTGYGSTNDIVMVGHGGNVGIGNASPAERLDVSGNIKASGNISANSITINGVTISSNGTSITVNGNVLATGDITGGV